MDTKEKLALLVFVFGGGFIAGLNGNNAFGVIVGALAGFGLLGLLMFIADEIDLILAEHYTKKGRF
jgi:hypothetical protein